MPGAVQIKAAAPQIRYAECRFLLRVEAVQQQAVILDKGGKQKIMLPPHFVTDRHIIFILDRFHRWAVQLRALRCRFQRRKLPSAAGNRRRARAGEQVAADRADVKTSYPLMISLAVTSFLQWPQYFLYLIRSLMY